MEKPTKLLGTAFCCNPVSGEANEYGETIWYPDCYLLYIDKMGTSHQIREKDDVYDNRTGFCQLSILYHRCAEIFHKYFNENFKFFGFSDTVLAVIPSEGDNKISSQTIAQTAILLFIELTTLNLPVRIFITRGNLGYHEFKGLIAQSAGIVCPVYGTALLNAYDCETNLHEFEIKCIGVFSNKSSFTDIKTLKIRKLGDEIKEIRLIDFKHYLNPHDFNTFKEFMQSRSVVQTIDELQKITFDGNYANGESIHPLLSDLTPEKRDEMLTLIKSGNERKIQDQAFISPYYSHLVEAIEKGELIIDP